MVKNFDAELPAGYVAARHEYDERYGPHIARARNWRIVAMLTAATALLAVCGLLWLSSRARVVPFVVMVDRLGRPVASGLADQTGTADERLIKATLFAWLEAARTVTPDDRQQRKFVDHAEAHVAHGTQADAYLNDFYRADSPYARAQTESVAVQVNDVLASTNRTYTIDWTETTRDNFGVVKSTERWKASMTFMTIVPTKQEEILINHPRPGRPWMEECSKGCREAPRSCSGC